MIQNLIELEERGWQALVSGYEAGRAFYDEVLAESAVMVFPGEIMIIGKDNILESMGVQSWKSYRFGDMSVVTLSDTVRVVVYKVAAQPEGGGPYIALISSSYTMIAGE